MFIATALWAAIIAHAAVCIATQPLSNVSTNEALSDNLRYKGEIVGPVSPAGTIPRALRHAVRGLDMTDDDAFNFKVPKTNLRVSVFPWEPEVPLDSDEVIDCLEAMHARLSRRGNTEKIIQKVIEESSSTQLTLEPLLYQEGNTITGDLINCGDAIRLFEEFYEYIDVNDLYVIFQYQVYNVTDYVAVGWLKPLKWSAGQNFPFSLAVAPSAEATPARTVID